MGSNSGMEPRDSGCEFEEIKPLAAVSEPDAVPRLESAAEEDAVLGWVDILYGVITQPAATLRTVARGDYLHAALLVFLLVEGVAWFLQITIAARGPAADTFARLVPLLAVASIPRVVVKLGMMMAVVGVLGSIIFLLVGAGIFNLLAEILFNGKGNTRGLLAGLALATLPTILGAPFQLMFFLFSWPSLIINLVSLGLWVWALGLKVMAIREAAELSTARALAVYLIPGVSVVVLILIFLVGGGVTLSTFMGGLGG